MYNAEVKEIFLTEFTDSTSRRNVARALFEATQKYEEGWGCDISCCKVNDLMEVLPDLIGVRTKSQSTRLSILRSYTAWCISYGLEDTNPDIVEIVLPEDFGLNKVRQQMVASPWHLQKYLDVLCDPIDKLTVDVTIRCYLWLAFAEVSEDDAMKVRSSDVNLPMMSIDFQGKRYPIYREGAQTISTCASTMFFYQNHPLHKSRPQPRASSDVLIRGFKEKSALVYRTEVSRRYKKKQEDLAKNGVDLNLSYYRVMMSGIFYRAYEEERCTGIAPTFMKLAGQFMEGKVYHLEKCGNLPGAKQRSLAKEYREDYNRWKRAFEM